MTTVQNGKAVSEMHARLLAARAGEVEKHTKLMADLDAAISAIVNRHVLPASADRPACRHCGGPMVAEPSSPTGFVHDRDGSPACQPGHSSTVAEPLDHTTMWPAVSAQQAVTEVIPAISVATCKNCGKRLHFDRQLGQWLHDHSFTNCEIDPPSTTYGEPAPSSSDPCPHCGEVMTPHEGRLVHTATGDTECEPPVLGGDVPALTPAVRPGRDVSDTRPDERKRGAK